MTGGILLPEDPYLQTVEAQNDIDQGKVADPSGQQFAEIGLIEKQGMTAEEAAVRAIFRLPVAPMTMSSQGYHLLL